MTERFTTLSKTTLKENLDVVLKPTNFSMEKFTLSAAAPRECLPFFYQHSDEAQFISHC